jgi:hypothetical protein
MAAGHVVVEILGVKHPTCCGCATNGCGSAINVSVGHYYGGNQRGYGLRSSRRTGPRHDPMGSRVPPGFPAILTLLSNGSMLMLNMPRLFP